MTRLFLLTLIACGGTIPDHLRIDPPAASAPDVEVADLTTALAWGIGDDPLARRPRLLDPAVYHDLPGGAPLAHWAGGIRQAERGELPPAVAMQQVEDRWRGTAAVPLTRGYRLGVLQQRAAPVQTRDRLFEAEAAHLLTPLREAPPDLGERMPLQWAVDGTEWKASVLAYGDRRVLLGWLDGPEIPLKPVDAALAGPQYDRLQDVPVVRLIRARAQGATAEVEPGLADLRRATFLELNRAAADRDREQAAWSDLRRETAEELGADDPVIFLLQRAFDQLTEAAGEDRAGGAAVLTLAAMGWRGTCEPGPCQGLDRVDLMRTAGRWHPEVEALARTWRVIALKNAVDTMDVGRDTPLFPSALVDLLDALLGTGAGPFDASLLQRPRPEPAVWLAVGRALGVDGTTEWEDARRALGQHLEREAMAALADADPELRPLLERIGGRAARLAP